MWPANIFFFLVWPSCPKPCSPLVYTISNLLHIIIRTFDGVPPQSPAVQSVVNKIQRIPSTNVPAFRVECLGWFLRRNLFIPPVSPTGVTRNNSRQLVICHRINCICTSPLNEATNNNATEFICQNVSSTRPLNKFWKIWFEGRQLQALGFFSVPSTHIHTAPRFIMHEASSPCNDTWKFVRNELRFIEK
jgi:hypothetical protein